MICFSLYNDNLECKFEEKSLWSLDLSQRLTRMPLVLFNILHKAF